MLLSSSLSGCGVTFLTFCFFKCVHKACEYLPLPSSVIERKDAYRIFRWRNLVISWFHACVVGFWSLLCVYLYFEQMWKDMYLFFNVPSFALCCFTMGYFAYDTLDIICARRISEKWEILLHHSAIIFSAGYIIVSTHCVGYQVFAMLIELNTSFLHTRKLMQMAAVPRKHFLVQLNVYVNLITFVLFRFVPLGVLFYGIFKDGHRVPGWFLIQYTICVAVLFCINFVLLYRLLKADVLCPISGSSLSADDKTTTIFADKRLALGKHRKIDSTGGFCCSLNIISDEYPPSSNGVKLVNKISSGISMVNTGKKAAMENEQVDLRLRSNVGKMTTSGKSLK